MFVLVNDPWYRKVTLAELNQPKQRYPTKATGTNKDLFTVRPGKFLCRKNLDKGLWQQIKKYE